MSTSAADWRTIIQRIAMKGRTVQAQPRMPAAVRARSVARDLAGVTVTLHATDCYGPCIWRIFFDDQARLTALSRDDGSDLTEEVIAPSPNLVDIAITIARDSLGILE